MPPARPPTLSGDFPVEAQRELVRRAVEAVGFDLSRGRVDVSAHPFCSAAGPSDVRLTTRYEGRPFPDSLMSALHEAGHGIYEQGLLDENFGTPMGEACSFGIHESQSRLVENFVARSRGFWDRFLPVARPLFPGALAGVDAAAFCRALNGVRPGLIRVDADEVTYNLHIVVRFELERAMLRGELAAGDLPGAWNEAYRRELGITPPDDATGCLQDIHWSIGSVGYFPTYSLGNVYAAQFYAKAEEELGDLEAAYRRGEFAPLRGWLRERIHRHGKRLPPRRLVEEVTGAPPDPAFLARHMEARYAVPG
jgi:carboxypeptidase Taq